MKIVVIGGTGLVGAKVVENLSEHGHDVVAAAPSTGVNTVTGAGLSRALTGAKVVVDASDPQSFGDDTANEFFRTSTANLLKAEKDADVRHHVALSIVGIERLALGGSYFQAKLEQEGLVSSGPIPYTIVRATQFFEFLRSIADATTVGDAIRVPPVQIQPIASADVAEAVATAAAGAPVQDITEIGGPERFWLDDALHTILAAHGDRRPVVADPTARYWGSDVDEHTLLPGDGATLFDLRLTDWILESAARRWRSTAD